MALQSLLQDRYEDYLQFLRDLVGMRSDFMHPVDAMKVMQYCKGIFEKNLKDYDVYLDAENNLVALPHACDPSKDLLYLNAHVDTVGANEEEWDEPFHPWKPSEDGESIVARGVSDCKAGVALELMLSALYAEGALALHNVIFTLSFKEEGGGVKSATEIGKELGDRLPLSDQKTYLVVLENTVTVQEPSVLSVYLGERSNYVISVEGTMRKLQEILQKLNQWNPVSIEPLSDGNQDHQTIISQQGAHVCSVPRDQNKLTSVIAEAKENTVVTAGQRENIAVVPSEIVIGESKELVLHRLTLSNRSFDSLEDVQNQLEGLEYEEEKDMHLSTGFNCEDAFRNDPIAAVCEDCSQGSDIDIEYTYNIGASDATRLYCSLDAEKRSKFIPIVMGPGSRSQRDRNPPRLTHGKNETFDKQSGLQSICYIGSVLEKMGFVNVGQKFD